jgi:hypothetical protein
MSKSKGNVRISTPTVPSFLISDGASVSVCLFSDDQLREVGARWTEELIAKAHRQRANVDREYERRGGAL